MSEGIKFDQNKTRYDLLAPDALEAIAQVFTYGAVKYAPVAASTFRPIPAWYKASITDSAN